MYVGQTYKDKTLSNECLQKMKNCKHQKDLTFGDANRQTQNNTKTNSLISLWPHQTSHVVWCHKTVVACGS